MDFIANWGGTFLWAQVIGLCAVFCCVISMQFKTSKYIILCGVPANSLWALQYVLLGAPTGAIANMASAINKLLIVLLPQNFLPYLLSVYLLSIWGIGLYNLEFWYALFPLIGATVIITPLFIDRDNRALYARATIIGCSLWACYNITVGSYMGLACDTLTITSSIIGMYRHENWKLGKCYRRFIPNLTRALFDFPKFRTYP